MDDSAWLVSKLIERRALAERVRKLWGAFSRVPPGVADLLQAAADQVMVVDCVPLPAYRSGQAATDETHWLWESGPGHGGHGGGW